MGCYFLNSYQKNEDPKIVTLTAKLTLVAIFLETPKSEYCTNAIATVDMATVAANGLIIVTVDKKLKKRNRKKLSAS